MSSVIALVPKDVPSLDAYLKADKGIVSAYIQTMAAIARSDGSVTVPEFSALSEIASRLAEQSATPAVTAVQALSAIEETITTSAALSALSKEAKNADRSIREALLKIAMPMLRVQGFEARQTAGRLAKALGLTFTATDARQLPEPDNRGIVGNISQQTKQLFRKSRAIDDVIPVASAWGEADLIEKIRAYKSGSITREELHHAVQALNGRILGAIADYRQQAMISRAADQAALSLISNAEKLRDQINQRLALIEKRLLVERERFAWDCKNVIHDAGNVIALEIEQRLRTDKWKDAQVWENIAKTQVGKEIQIRLSELKRRYEESVFLLKEDLRIFQNELRLTHVTIMDEHHRRDLSKLMPAMRVGTRVLNATDSAANATLFGGSVATAGAAGAAYLLGAGVVLPLITPALPFVAGALGVAGLYKWMANPSKRKAGEIEHKRQGIEEALKSMLTEVETALHKNLDQIGVEFSESAQKMICPIMLEAEAAKSMVGLRERLAERVVELQQQVLETIGNALAELSMEGAKG